MLPPLARLLLRLTDPAVREFIAGDLEETRASMADAEGDARARWWTIRQALAAARQHPWRPRPPHLRGDGFMRTLLQDLRYGLRMVRGQPAFSLVVVMTLALAIGANSVIFSFANILLLRPLPLKDPATLAWIFALDPHHNNARGPLSIPELLDYRDSLTTFDALGATSRTSVTLTGRGDARRLIATRVTADLHTIWGLRVAAGRGFSASANRPGAAGEVVLSDRYWRREFAANPSIIGDSLMLDGRPATIVGVLAPDIEIGNLSEIDVWIPLSLSPTASRDDRTLRVVGRLKAGVTLAQAAADARLVAQRLARDHPKENEGWSATILPTRDAMTGANTWIVLTLLSVVVGLVLLLACANLANLMLSRATGRARELAVRSALGASRARVVRQMLTENLVYGVCGGALGLLVAGAGLAAIRAAAYEPFFEMVGIDRNVFLFTGALALLTPMIFAILPALHATRAGATGALKDGGTRTAGRAGAARSRGVLIVAQLGLAVMLLVLATLLAQALRNLVNAPFGFDVPRLLTARLDLPAWRYGDATARTEYADRLLARLQSRTGIAAAALATRLPIVDGEPVTTLVIDGRPAVRPEDRPWAVVTTVTEAYFAAAGVRIVSGRGFTIDDRPGRVPAAIVNSEMARRHWGSEDRAIGARLTLPLEGEDRSVEIVGVSSNVLRADREAVNPQLYVTARQHPLRSAALLVRAEDPGAVAADVRAAVRAVDVDVPVYDMRPMQAALDDDMSSSVVLQGMFLAFALLALVLAASGLYAVVSYAASQRVKEFGVRIALGASSSDIVVMMLGQTARLVAIGLALGLLGGRALAMMATALLYRVSPSDPATYIGVAVMLGAIAFAASYLPARRAMAIDPVRALRLE